MSKIVKYNNQMNEINFGGYSEKELNMFFSLVFLAKEKGTSKLIIPFSELKELSDGDKNRERFIVNLINVNRKLIKLNHQIEIDNIIHIFSLFNTFSIDKNADILVVQVNEIFSYMLNDLVANFTRFDLIEFVNLKSIYSKNTFKLLKQWESQKKVKYELDKFRTLLGVPAGYNTTNFNERVLKPIMEELPKVFEGLELQKIKTGKKITGLIFSWKRKIDKNNPIIYKEPSQDTFDIIEISDILNKVIEKAKKNRFIENLLNLDNIEILLEMFEEEQLVKGLNWSYQEIKQEIKSLNYLIKAIKTGIQKKEKKLVIKSKQEEIKEISLISTSKVQCDESQAAVEEGKNREQSQGIKQVEKIKITQEEYDQMYKEYLKKNDSKDIPLMKTSFKLSLMNKYEIVKLTKKENVQTKIYSEADIDENLLLTKTGKRLSGIAKTNRVNKILKEMNATV